MQRLLEIVAASQRGTHRRRLAALRPRLGTRRHRTNTSSGRGNSLRTASISWANHMVELAPPQERTSCVQRPLRTRIGHSHPNVRSRASYVYYTAGSCARVRASRAGIVATCFHHSASAMKRETCDRVDERPSCHVVAALCGSQAFLFFAYGDALKISDLTVRGQGGDGWAIRCSSRTRCRNCVRVDGVELLVLVMSFT